MILGGCFDIIVVNGESGESIGEGSGLRGLDWLSGECFMEFRFLEVDFVELLREPGLLLGDRLLIF